jgi:peptide chain release factor 3
MPIFALVNKCDRVGEDPLKLVSDVETDLGINCHPVTWPIHRDGTFVGVYDRRKAQIYLFDRSEDHGAKRATGHEGRLDSPEIVELLGHEAHQQLLHDLELLEAAGHPFDHEEILSGALVPVFFGSALTNFGVEPFFREFLELAPAPTSRESTIGPVQPTQEEFTGFVFKIQANMDPKHRDRIAFVRVCSGKFEAGMPAMHVRTGKTVRLNAPQQFMARERTIIEEAWPGDVIGIMDRGNLRIGDSLTEGEKLEFSDIPRFPPEHFARVVLKDPIKRKQLDAGLRQLTEEGAAQVFYTSHSDVSQPTPIVGAVGVLQFDVMLHRLEHEYGVRCKLEPISARYPRWVTGKETDIDRLAAEPGRLRIFDALGNPVILFESEWAQRWTVDRVTALAFHESAP